MSCGGSGITLAQWRDMPSPLKLDRVQIPVKFLRPEVQPAAKKADAQSPGEAPNDKVSVYELQHAQGISDEAKQRAIKDVKALAYAYSKGALDVVGETKEAAGPERKFVKAPAPSVVKDLISGQDIFTVDRIVKDAMQAAATGSKPPEIEVTWVPTHTDGHPFYKEHADVYFHVQAEQRDLQNVLNSIQASALRHQS
jgi:hypothetical protein